MSEYSELNSPVHRSLRLRYGPWSVYTKDTFTWIFTLENMLETTSIFESTEVKRFQLTILLLIRYLLEFFS